MNQRIEPGCLAMIAATPSGENDGTMITVVKFIGYSKVLGKNQVWEIDRDLQYFYPETYAPWFALNLIEERYLRRIDGYDGETLETDENESIEETC